ncbi:MAG: hypothetical protein U0V04_17435 [Spirosomataceae bacterium]
MQRKQRRTPINKAFTPKTNGMVERSNYTIKHGTLKKKPIKTLMKCLKV